jgi:hypothetical protein
MVQGFFNPTKDKLAASALIDPSKSLPIDNAMPLKID